jgi:hypothetical protein
MFNAPGYRITAEEELLKYPQWQPVTPESRAEASRLLADAGYPNGLDVTALTIARQDWVAPLLVIGQQAKPQFRVDVISQEHTAAYEGWEAGRYDIGIPAMTMLLAHPWDQVAAMFIPGGGRNFHRVDDPWITQQGNDALFESDPVKQKAMWLELQQYVVDHLTGGWATQANWINRPVWEHVRNYNRPMTGMAGTWIDVWKER